MWILSIDTATKVTGLAIHRAGNLVAESFLHTDKTHSERLMPMIMQIMEQAGIGFADLNAVAVTSGPGSFTGLRIGMATAKGIAQVRQIPVLGVNTLDALAQHGVNFPGVVVPILDARKDEVYTAVFRSEHGHLSRYGDYRAINPVELANELVDVPENILFVGDAVPAYRNILQDILGAKAVFHPDSMSMPRGSHVGYLAVKRFAKGETDDLFALKPFYIRPSEAEVTWARKFGKGMS
ncbi:MAG TPA: tRNA (adenosine(37)-N6)-threonylcarbamoyltransferase complex dimerization subunit type 1 TsaB [Verrucomicrobiae bacterium]|nr:tRNA (adenosine(37)-N6)-threonylcarbamoyltransferase complex dimerization subunit type 1 TsaB [Verrucomicrobiae bacterium]